MWLTHGVGVLGGEQRVGRHVHRVGVGDERGAVAIAEAGGFRLQMQAFRPQRIEARELEALQDVEDEQRDDPLPVGRALVDVEAPVVGADRLDLLRREGGEIVRRHRAAVGGEVGGDLVGDGAAIEGVAAALRDQAQRLRQCRQAVDGAGGGRAAAGQVEGAGVLAGLELLRIQRPVVGDAAVDDEAFLGIADGGLQHRVEAHGAVVREQPLPGADGARHGDRMRALEADGVDAPLPEPVHAQPRRRGTRAVDGVGRHPAARRIEREAVAADAGRLRLDHTLDGAGRDRRIHGIGARSQHLDRRRRGQRVRGRRHAAHAVDHGPPRLLKVPHRLLPSPARRRPVGMAGF